MDMNRYARQTMLPEIGESGQQRLLNSRVLVIGLGGLGSPVCTYLTGAGIGTLILADADRVSLTNLQRQTLYTESQIGMLKTEAAKERLQAMSSVTRYELHPEGFTADNSKRLVAGVDLVMDCCDNYETRYLINDVCQQTGCPWIYGSIGDFQGQVSVFNYKMQRQYTELYPDREYLCSLPRATRGVIGAVAGITGSIEAAEAIKLLAGFGQLLEGKLFAIDIKRITSSIIEF